jgi:hypothetical protein
MPINRRTALAMLGAGLVGLGSTHATQAEHAHCCPDCGHKQCCPTPAVVKEKKTIYSCQCKDICIPGIKGPFAPCCEAPSCGRVRTIKVLRKMEIECQKCGYKWDVKSVGCQSCK